MANTLEQTTRNTSSRYADASTQRATAENGIECAYRALGEGAAQQGLSMSTFEDVMGVPAWKAHPTWYLVATEDQAIPPDAERMFAQRMGATTVEIPSNHLAMVSHPEEVVGLIARAASGAPVAP